MLESQAIYIREARVAYSRGHKMEGSAVDERTAYGKCRDCGAELVITVPKVTTRPEGNCTGPTG